MLSKDFKDMLIDRFEGYELVDYLRIQTEDIIDAFEDEIEERVEDLEEFLNYGE